MKLGYKRLGDYIRLVDERNRNLEVETLLGVSIRKVLMPSIANIIGTDMSTYKIIRKNQFAYGTVTSRNGNKISIALLKKHEKALVSQVYLVFEIIDETVVLPDYLMMWFRRPEFDRYARFKSHGSARETFDWAEMLETELPIPSLEKQNEIIAEYEVLENRIQLNKKLCATLEETAQTIYKHWFEDFEFPDENGKPYQSSGGEMVVCEELGKEIPKGWRVGKLDDIVKISSGKGISEFVNFATELNKYPLLGAGGVNGYTKEYNFDKNILVIGRVGTHGKIQRLKTKCWASDNTLIIIPNYYEYVYQFLGKINYTELNRGGVQALITQTDIKNLPIIVPDLEILNLFERDITTIFTKVENAVHQTQKLAELKSLLLGKMAVEK